MTQTHLITHGKPITDLNHLSEHLVLAQRTAAILNTGMAAREAVVMPGACRGGPSAALRPTPARLPRPRSGSTTPTRTASSSPTRPSRRCWTRPRTPRRFAPAWLSEPRCWTRPRRCSSRPGRTRALARAKIERVARRFTTQIPNVERMDLGDPSSAKVGRADRPHVPQPGRLREARQRLRAGAATSRPGARSCAACSCSPSTPRGCPAPRPAGTSWSGSSPTSRGAREAAVRLRRDLEILTDRGQRSRSALYPDQISKTVILPSMREMNYLADQVRRRGLGGQRVRLRPRA
jgi:hypothetical protein